MIRSLFTAAVIVSVSAVTAMAGTTTAHVPEPCQVLGEKGSILCAGLVEHFDLTEASDSPRFGSYTSVLQEAPGQNVAQEALDLRAWFDGSTSKWLWANVPAPGSAFSIAFRIRPNLLGSSGQKQSVISWDNQNFKGPDIYFENNAGTGRMCLKVYEAEAANTARTACTSSTTLAEHFIVVGASHFHDGKAEIWISQDGGPRTTTTVTYWLHGGPRYMRVAGRPYTGPGDASDQPLTAYLSDLDFYIRPLSDAEIALLYNGSPIPHARAYPYDTN